MGEEFFHLLGQVKRGDDQIDQLDSDKRNDETAEAVDQQVALQNRERAHRFVSDAAQRQRNQRDDDERVENDGAEDRAGGGCCKCMMLSGAISGNVAISIAGTIAKYFATSFAMLKVVSDPRVISICFPISTMSSSFVGLVSRSTMLPASRAACVPVFMATPTSACASAGASFVPSPVMATR